VLQTWFGPEQFNDETGLAVTMKIKLRDTGNITFSLVPYATTPNKDALAAASIVLCTNGSWSIGSKSSDTGLNMSVGEWQQVHISRSNHFLTASVGGLLLANESIPAKGPGSDNRNFTLKVMLSHYYSASIDDFMISN
jgi:hypothetical protein